MSLEHEEKIIELKKYDNKNSKEMRELASVNSKDFKTSWIKLAMILYGIWENKSYEYWGYEKFEHYTEKELGINKSLGNKLVKTYRFVEDSEPLLINQHCVNETPTEKLPGIEEVNVLRRAKSKKELTPADYEKIRTMVMVDNKPLAEVRKELTSIIKERKMGSPTEEKAKKTQKCIKKVVAELNTFKFEAELEKFLPTDLIKKVKDLALEIESHL